MIRADMIPDEVVEALHTSLADDAGVLVPKGDCVAAIAAALNAWPGMDVAGDDDWCAIRKGWITLPQEARDE